MCAAGSPTAGAEPGSRSPNPRGYVGRNAGIQEGSGSGQPSRDDARCRTIGDSLAAPSSPPTRNERCGCPPGEAQGPRQHRARQIPPSRRRPRSTLGPFARQDPGPDQVDSPPWAHQKARSFESFQTQADETADVSLALETIACCNYPSPQASLRNGIEEADGSIPFSSTKSL
jgi:hypothetical protein